MKNNKGFIISTTLYSAFGIMMITVATILFVLSNNTATMTSMTDKLKLCIEECDTPENICDGVCSCGEDPPTPEYPKLADLILGEKFDNIYDSGEQSSRGLYKSYDTNSGKPIYYFKGNSSKMNNYVQFGTWKNDTSSLKYSVSSQGVEVIDKVNKKGEPIIWRVLRINEDGSIRLVTEDNIKYTTDPKSVIYNDSGLKTSLEKWYSDTIGEDSRVIKGIFCNDIQNTNTNKVRLSIDVGDVVPRTYGPSIFSDATYRIVDGNPTFKCPEDGIVESKIGTITADEVVLSGIGFKENSSSFLYNNSRFWTMTPSQFGTYSLMLFSVYKGEQNNGLKSKLLMDVSNSNDTGLYDDFSAQFSYAPGWGVRAVINLSPDVTVSSGTGLNPYDAYVIDDIET